MTLHTGRFKLLLFAALSIFAVSCDDTGSSQISPEGKGLVMLDLRPEIEIKSAEAVADGVDNYNFRFVGVDGYATSDYYRFGDVQWPMEWYFGVFRLQAESCTSEEAETLRGRLRYEGISSPFSVVNDRTATASVICYVANFQVKVNFDDTMYEAFDDYKLTVMSVSAPPVEEDDEEGTEEDDVTEEFVPETFRTLDFNPFELSGYYNLPEVPVRLYYVLYVKMQDADEFIEAKAGYFSAGDSVEPTIVNAGDIITFDVKYTGTVTVTDGVKFIVSGRKDTVGTGLDLEDYDDAKVEEDK